MRPRRVVPSVLLGALAALLAVPAAEGADRAGGNAGQRPSRVVVLVVDALSPEVVDRYRMRRVQQVMRDGANFGNAYLGHIGAETVVTHNVLTTGVLPNHLGYTDEGYRDVAGLLTGLSTEPENPYWVTSDFTAEQLFTLQRATGQPKLADYLHAAQPGSTVATVSPKTYAGYAMGGPGADMIVTFSSRNFDCDGDGVNNWRGPAGIGVPEYLSQPQCGRWYVDSASSLTYDTLLPPARMYPLDGNRYTVGRDPAHLGSDIWATDAALAIMDHEPDWSGIFLTLPGVDKAAHMWGSVDDPGGPEPMTHLPAAAAVADAQVGRVVDHLKQRGWWEDTLLVLTSDHGQLPSRRFHGLDDGSANRGFENWYYGDTANGDYLDPAPDLKPLADTGNVALSYQDSAIRTWLKDRTPAAVRSTAAVMRGLPDVVAVYARQEERYRLTAPARERLLPPAERRWFRRHAQELVDTSAAPYGPDLIGLLRADTSYGVAGDHGGVQRRVQQIPIVFAGGTVGSRDQPGAIRSVDVMPTLLRQLRIAPTAPLDGRAYPLPHPRRG